VLLWWHRRRVRLGRAVAIFAGGLGVAAFVVWKVFPEFAEMYWLRLSYTAEFLTSGTESVFSGRLASWRTLVAWIEANPLQAVVGIGYKTLPYTQHLGAPVVADNMYLSLLVETGIAGLAALVWLNWAIVSAAARAARSADSRRAFCGLWMLCFWCGEIVQMASGDLLTYWRVLPVYFFVLAFGARI
jgi:O-antigen ligase